MSVSQLSKSRIERICQGCGKPIHVGDLYLNRPKTVNEIRCEKCYTETFNNWLEKHSNLGGLREELVKFISVPRTLDEINNVFGDKTNKLLKDLVMKGLPIVYSEDSVYLDYQLKEKEIPEPDTRSMDIACIRAIVSELLNMEGIPHNGLMITIGESVIIDDSKVDETTVFIDIDNNRLNVEHLDVSSFIEMCENNEMFFNMLSGIVIDQ